MNGTFYQSFRVFISSPGDALAERKIAEEEISLVSNSCRDTLGISVECIKWEHLPPSTPPAGGVIQDVIDEDLVRSCNVFVLILHKRWGTADAGQTRSHTEQEVDVALDMLRRGRNIMLLSYFLDFGQPSDPGEQQRKLEALKQRLREEGLWIRSYKDSRDFRQRFSHDLYHTILKFRVSTSKRKALASFWQFGVAEGDSHPKLAIVYPPLDRAYMHHLEPDTIWLSRLVPHIVYEDYRAIQKIDKTLRLIGFSDFAAYTVPCVPPDIEDQNRVWICLPRNQPGMAQLGNYMGQARFRLVPRKGKKEARLYWRRAGSDADELEVQSPLADYLKEQRRGHAGGEWTRENSRIIAKDYAILARFSQKRDRRPTVHGTLKDYFIAGIRGLGTWGAGWFIDRRYNLLQAYAENEDAPIQILLEVIYRDERIVEVRDVSREPASYFRSENNLATVRKHVREFQKQLPDAQPIHA